MSKLWYNTPADDWNEALPIGNGRIGAMVFGDAMLDRLQINEETLWSGSPDLEKIAQAYDMPFIRVENMSQADAAIDQFLNTEGSVLMECLVDPMDLV